MVPLIQNKNKLASSPLRKDALEIVEAGFASIDTETILKKNITVVDGIMTIMGQQFNLADYTHIYIIGFGKVSCTAAYVLEKLLEGKVKEGAVIGIKESLCQIVDTYAGTHPLPSHYNFTATQHIEEIARKAGKDDLVIVVVSGGGSALLCSSLDECDQGQKLYTSFLQSGGTIEELNVVRKHISRLKGGGLAQVLYPATVVSLVFSDVPGGDMASIASGPTIPSTTTLADAQKIIEKYKLGDFRLMDKPKDEKYFERVHNILLVSNVTALKAMEEAALARGYCASVISAARYATAPETKEVFLKDAFPNSVWCMGGETRMIVPHGVSGKGGRNTHLALTMLDSLKDGQVFVSFASDGHDNTEAAGAIVDRTTWDKATQKSLRYEEYYENYDSYSFFEKTEDLLITPPLESNVADLMLLLSSNQETH